MSDLPRCHWCNRPIDADELVIAILPAEPGAASSIVEQSWHTVCYSMIQGVPGADDD